MTRHVWTIRTRLACLYGVLVLGAGGLLLGITYFLVHRSMLAQPVNTTIVLSHVSGGAATTGATPPPTPEPTVGAAQQVGSDYELARRLQADFRAETLANLAVNGLAALGVLTIAGAWVGWLVAGRSLRPIQQIAAIAMRVGDSRLHERISLGGRRDELRELADTLDEMLSRLTAAFDSQRRFVANASHELRTPLAISRALLDNAVDEPGTPPETRELAGILLEVNERQERLIEGLMTLAQSEQARFDLVPVDMTKIVAQVAAAARSRAHESAIEIVTQLSPASAVGDQVLLERLVQNLVENALRYNTTGGRAWLACHGEADKVILTVANTGAAVADSEVESLFEPFRRLAGRVSAEGGSGLGLSIVRSIARAHGGHAAATPRDSGGLIVTITLPRCQHAGMQTSSH